MEEELEHGGIQGQKPIFEIAGWAGIDSFVNARPFFKKFRHHGCRFRLDDFGEIRARVLHR